jgi:7,8-dihydro-6-hydroxymethylpterin-pyrophosphokinase
MQNANETKNGKIANTALGNLNATWGKGIIAVSKRFLRTGLPSCEKENYLPLALLLKSNLSQTTLLSNINKIWEV